MRPLNARVVFAFCASTLIVTLVIPTYLLWLSIQSSAIAGSAHHAEAEAAMLADTRPPGVAGDYRFAGRVVANSSGEPFERVRVVVMEHAKGHSWTTSTNAQGRWSVDRLPAGEYSISASRDDLQEEYSGWPPYILGPTTPGHDIATRMFRGGRIEGRVVDELGRAVSSAIVMALTVTDSASQSLPQVGGRTFTDRMGKFVLTGLRDGEWIVAAREDFAGATRHGYFSVGTYHPDTAEWTSATRFRISDGVSRDGLKLRLKSGRGFSVSGEVVDEAGNPLEVHLRYQRDEGPLTSGYSGNAPSGSGRFRFERLTSGRYFLSANGERPDGRVLYTRKELLVDGKDVTGLVLTLRPPTRIRGRIVDERGTRPVTKGRLSMMPPGQNSWGSDMPGEGGHVNADGTFEIATSVTGAGRIVAIQPTGGWEVQSVLHRGLTYPDNVIPLRDGELLDDVTIVAGRKTSVISGTVASASTSTCVVIMARDPGAPPRCVYTLGTRNGEFRSFPLRAGTYRVAGTCTGKQPPDRLEDLWNRGTEVRVADDQTRTVELDRSSPQAPSSN